MSSSLSLPILVAGGGIGGVAAALALVRQGFDVKVLEQTAQLGEIGAGIQPVPALARCPHRARGAVGARDGAYLPRQGVARLVRNDLWRGRTPERFHDALQWLSG